MAAFMLQPPQPEDLILDGRVERNDSFSWHAL